MSPHPMPCEMRTMLLFAANKPGLEVQREVRP